MGCGDALEDTVGQESRVRYQHAQLPVRTPRIIPRPRESLGRRERAVWTQVGIRRVEVAVDDKHADRNDRAPESADHGHGDRRELLALNRYGKSSRCVATLGSRGLQASSPKPASWSSSGSSTWLRSSSLMCFDVLPGDLILNPLHRALRRRLFR